MIRTFLRHAWPCTALLLLAVLPARAGTDTCPEDCSEPAPPLVNIYSQTTAGHLSPATAGALPRVYVPNRSSNSVSVIDTTTLKEVDRFEVGRDRRPLSTDLHEVLPEPPARSLSELEGVRVAQRRLVAA